MTVAIHLFFVLAFTILTLLNGIGGAPIVLDGVANPTISSASYTDTVTIRNPTGTVLIEDSTFTSSLTIEMDSAWFAVSGNTQSLSITLTNNVIDGPVVIQRFRMTGFSSQIKIQDCTLNDATQSLLLADVTMSSTLGLSINSNTKLGNTTMERFTMIGGILSITYNGDVQGVVKMQDSSLSSNMILLGSSIITCVGNNVDDASCVMFGSTTFTNSDIRILDNTIHATHADPAIITNTFAVRFQSSASLLGSTTVSVKGNSFTARRQVTPLANGLCIHFESVAVSTTSIVLDGMAQFQQCHLWIRGSYATYGSVSLIGEANTHMTVRLMEITVLSLVVRNIELDKLYLTDVILPSGSSGIIEDSSVYTLGLSPQVANGASLLIQDVPIVGVNGVIGTTGLTMTGTASITFERCEAQLMSFTDLAMTGTVDGSPSLRFLSCNTTTAAAITFDSGSISKGTIELADVVAEKLALHSSALSSASQFTIWRSSFAAGLTFSGTSLSDASSYHLVDSFVDVPVGGGCALCLNGLTLNGDSIVRATGEGRLAVYGSGGQWTAVDALGFVVNAGRIVVDPGVRVIADDGAGSIGTGVFAFGMTVFPVGSSIALPYCNTRGSVLLKGIKTRSAPVVLRNMEVPYLYVTCDLGAQISLIIENVKITTQLQIAECDFSTGEGLVLINVEVVGPGANLNTLTFGSNPMRKFGFTGTINCVSCDSTPPAGEVSEKPFVPFSNEWDTCINTTTPSLLPTPTPTDSVTLTPAPTGTTSPTSTATPAETITPTATTTVTPAPTPSFSTSVSNTVVAMPSGTLSPTMSSPRTPTASLSPSATPVDTLSPTDSPTVTPAGSRSTSRTATQTLVRTPTGTASSTISPAETRTITRSNTITPPPTPSTSISTTATPARSSSITRTPTGTRPDTPSESYTGTASVAATPTRSVSWTLSPPSTATHSLTRSPSAWDTPTPTSSRTLSHVETPSSTVTASQTQRQTGSHSLSRSSSVTSALTSTPTQPATLSAHGSTPTVSATHQRSQTPSRSTGLTPTLKVSPSISISLSNSIPVDLARMSISVSSTVSSDSSREVFAAETSTKTIRPLIIQLGENANLFGSAVGLSSSTRGSVSGVAVSSNLFTTDVIGNCGGSASITVLSTDEVQNGTETTVTSLLSLEVPREYYDPRVSCTVRMCAAEVVLPNQTATDNTTQAVCDELVVEVLVVLPWFHVRADNITEGDSRFIRLYVDIAGWLPPLLQSTLTATLATQTASGFSIQPQRQAVVASPDDGAGSGRRQDGDPSCTSLGVFVMGCEWSSLPVNYSSPIDIGAGNRNVTVEVDFSIRAPPYYSFDVLINVVLASANYPYERLVTITYEPLPHVVKEVNQSDVNGSQPVPTLVPLTAAPGEGALTLAPGGPDGRLVRPALQSTVYGEAGLHFIIITALAFVVLVAVQQCVIRLRLHKRQLAAYVDLSRAHGWEFALHHHLWASAVYPCHRYCALIHATNLYVGLLLLYIVVAEVGGAVPGWEGASRHCVLGLLGAVSLAVPRAVFSGLYGHYPQPGVKSEDDVWVRESVARRIAAQMKHDAARSSLFYQTLDARDRKKGTVAAAAGGKRKAGSRGTTVKGCAYEGSNEAVRIGALVLVVIGKRGTTLGRSRRRVNPQPRDPDGGDASPEMMSPEMMSPSASQLLSPLAGDVTPPEFPLPADSTRMSDEQQVSTGSSPAGPGVSAARRPTMQPVDLGVELTANGSRSANGGSHSPLPGCEEELSPTARATHPDSVKSGDSPAGPADEDEFDALHRALSGSRFLDVSHVRSDGNIEASHGASMSVGDSPANPLHLDVDIPQALSPVPDGANTPAMSLAGGSDRADSFRRVGSFESKPASASSVFLSPQGTPSSSFRKARQPGDMGGRSPSSFRRSPQGSVRKRVTHVTMVDVDDVGDDGTGGGARTLDAIELRSPEESFNGNGSGILSPTGIILSPGSSGSPMGSGRFPRRGRLQKTPSWQRSAPTGEDGLALPLALGRNGALRGLRSPTGEPTEKDDDASPVVVPPGEMNNADLLALGGEALDDVADALNGDVKVDVVGAPTLTRGVDKDLPPKAANDSSGIDGADALAINIDESLIIGSSPGSPTFSPSETPKLGATVPVGTVYGSSRPALTDTALRLNDAGARGLMPRSALRKPGGSMRSVMSQSTASALSDLMTGSVASSAGSSVRRVQFSERDASGSVVSHPGDDGPVLSKDVTVYLHEKAGIVRCSRVQWTGIVLSLAIAIVLSVVGMDSTREVVSDSEAFSEFSLSVAVGVPLSIFVIEPLVMLVTVLYRWLREDFVFSGDETCVDTVKCLLRVWHPYEGELRFR